VVFDKTACENRKQFLSSRKIFGETQRFEREKELVPELLMNN